MTTPLLTPIVEDATPDELRATIELLQIQIDALRFKAATLQANLEAHSPALLHRKRRPTLPTSKRKRRGR